MTKELDYEVELTAVIGSAGRDIPRGEALRHVFGYTIINDVTARDLQKRHGQWFKGKSLDTFCPMGPILVTADEIPDPQALAVSLRVNGQVRQSSHTSKMIFPVDQCIEVLSQGLTLLPGDVIATGTPDGVGAATGNFLKVGDRMEAEVEHIGVLANRIARALAKRAPTAPAQRHRHPQPSPQPPTLPANFTLNTRRRHTDGQRRSWTGLLPALSVLLGVLWLAAVPAAAQTMIIGIDEKVTWDAKGKQLFTPSGQGLRSRWWTSPTRRPPRSPPTCP